MIRSKDLYFSMEVLLLDIGLVNMHNEPLDFEGIFDLLQNLLTVLYRQLCQ